MNWLDKADGLSSCSAEIGLRESFKILPTYEIAEIEPDLVSKLTWEYEYEHV